MPPRRSTRAAGLAAGDDDAGMLDTHDPVPAPPPAQAAGVAPPGGDTARDDAVALLNDAKLATTGEAKVSLCVGEREREQEEALRVC